MKKPAIVFAIYFILISLIVYACGTKNDPSVPNHTSNVTTNSNSLTFVTSSATYNYNFGFFKCGSDTSTAKHYSMSAKEISSGFIISIIYYDSVAPGGTYMIVNPITTPTITSGQCVIFISAPPLSSSEYIATSGTINCAAISGSLKVIMNNVPVINTADSTNTAKISGMWGCQ